MGANLLVPRAASVQQVQTAPMQRVGSFWEGEQRQAIFLLAAALAAPVQAGTDPSYAALRGSFSKRTCRMRMRK